MKKSSNGNGTNGNGKVEEDEFIDIEEIQGRNHDRNVAIMVMVVAGEKYTVIAKEFHLTPAAISHIAIQNGYIKRPEVSFRAETVY
jgi:hypothetical protein